MEPEDRDQTNAALLLHEKIDERFCEALSNPIVVSALLNSPTFRSVLETYVQNEIALALQQLHERLRPVQYYGSNTTSTTSTTYTTYTTKRYW